MTSADAATPTSGPAAGAARAPRPARLVIRMLALLLLPCAAFALGAQVERADGPRWRWQGYDPEYAYLLNAVNITEGHAPGHTHHPGTPVQALGAAVLTVRHLLVGAPGATIRQEVLADPVSAIHAISVVLRLIHAAALAVLGVAGLRLTGSLICALVAQGGTLLSLSAVTSLHAVAPEPLLMSLSLLLAAAVMMCLARPRPVRARFGVISGVIVAAGIASKITFVPAALAVWGVLIGPRPRNRRLPLIHLAAVALAMPILLAPILSQIGTMVAWYRNLALNDGYYGRSATGHTIVNTERYPRNLWSLIEAEPVTAGVALVGVLLSAALFIPRLARGLDDPGRRARAALMAVAAAQVLQFLLVAKHTGPRYLIAAIALSGLAVCLSFILTRVVLPRRGVRWTVTAAALVGLACGGVMAFRGLRKFMDVRRDLSARQVALAQEAERLASKPGQPGSGAVLVYTYWSSSPAYAPHFGNHWAGLRFSEDLSRMFPDRVLYSPDAKDPYRDSRMNAVPRERLEAWAAEGRLYFHMSKRELPDGFRAEPVVPSGGLYGARLPR